MASLLVKHLKNTEQCFASYLTENAKICCDSVLEAMKVPVEAIKVPIETVRQPIDAVRELMEAVREPIEAAREPIERERAN